MNNRDFKNLTEAYNQIYLKEDSEMHDLAKQDPREGFPTHTQEHQDDDLNDIGYDKASEIAENLVHEIMSKHPNLNNEFITDTGCDEEIVEEILTFARERIKKLSDEITAKGDLEAHRREGYEEDGEEFHGESLKDCYSQVMIEEAKRKAVSAKKNINPWAVEKALEKKTGHHYSKDKKERIIKGIKKGANKYGKTITSKAIKKK